MNRKFKPLVAALLLAQQTGLLAQQEAPAEPVPAGVEEISVVARFIPQEKRSTATISNVLDANAFTVAGDSSVADGLKRVAGLNLQGGKFIYVRGLGERYSSTVLNGSSLPSPEPINRVVPLDLFPSSIIESVLVQKTYSAKYPAEFAGGTVQMRTKVAPDYNFFKMSGSLGYSGYTTGKDGLTYRGGDEDWMGKEDGTRDMPGPIKSAIANNRELRLNNRFYNKGFSPAELETLGESLSNNYSVQNETIEPDRSIGANFGRAWQLMDGDARVGVLGNIGYNNTFDTLMVTRNSYAADMNGDLSPADIQDWKATTETVDSSMFLTTGFEFRDDHKVKATVLQIHKMEDLAGQLTGELVSQDQIIRQNRLEYIEQDMLSEQIDGEHYFADLHELTINWHYNTSRAKREAPDMRQYRYFLDEEDGQYYFDLRPESMVRMWSDLRDENTDQGMSAAMSFDTPFNTFTDLTVGYMQADKTRDSDIRRFTILQQGSVNSIRSLLTNPDLGQIINSNTIKPDGFQLLEVTRPTDNYTASQTLDAIFAEADIRIGDHWRLLAGVRREESIQNVTTFNLFIEDDLVIGKLEAKDLFPTVTGTWIIDKYDMQMRASYSETTSRPDFRELSPAPFTHPVTGQDIVGNPNLEVAYIKNYDLRWEWYYSAKESLSVGLFYKEFTSPIEAIIKPGTEGLRSYVNADTAYTQGIEIDANHNLEFINERLADFYIASNVTLIESQVTIKPEQSGVITNAERALQGQADYIVNFQLGYDDGDNQKGSLVYHLTGPKIREVGVLMAPDVIDQKFGQLDLTYIHTFGENIELTAKVKNLLNQRQETTQGGFDINSFRDGISGSFGVSYEF